MLTQNGLDKRECKLVTEGCFRGKANYANVGYPGMDKTPNCRHEIYKDTPFRDSKTDGFSMGYFHGDLLQGERNHYYYGENGVHK